MRKTFLVAERLLSEDETTSMHLKSLNEELNWAVNYELNVYLVATASHFYLLHSCAYFQIIDAIRVFRQTHCYLFQAILAA
jgi:hypothetical protein